MNCIYFFHRSWSVFLALICILSLSVSATGQTGLPPEIQKIFFEESDFNDPIYLELPIESSLTEYNAIVQTPLILESGIPSVKIELGKGVEDYNPYLLSCLVKKGHARIEKLVQTTRNINYGDKDKEHYFLFYSNAFRKNIEYFSDGNLTGNGAIVKPYVKLAKRQLVLIDYKNRYEDSPMGLKRTFFSILFTYRFVNLSTMFPSVTTVFKGKAKTYLDPDDGKWKMKGDFENLGIILDDNGAKEFVRSLSSGYEPFNFKNASAPAKTDVTLPSPSDEKDVLAAADVMPEYLGGENALEALIVKSIIYPKDALEARISGKVLVSFVVDETGRVTGAKIARGIGPSLDAEALRIVSTLSSWKPGKNKGKNVKVRRTVSVPFKTP